MSHFCQTKMLSNTVIKTKKKQKKLFGFVDFALRKIFYVMFIDVT